MSISMRLPEDKSMYCVRCRALQLAKRRIKVTLANGAQAYKGRCRVCSTPMRKIIWFQPDKGRPKQQGTYCLDCLKHYPAGVRHVHFVQVGKTPDLKPDYQLTVGSTKPVRQEKTYLNCPMNGITHDNCSTENRRIRKRGRPKGSKNRPKFKDGDQVTLTRRDGLWSVTQKTFQTAQPQIRPCEMTVTTEHVFDNRHIIGWNYNDKGQGVPIHGRICLACGLIDDRKLEKA